MRFGPALGLLVALLAPPAAAERWTMDRDHADVTFSLDRAGFALIEGRFDAFDAEIDVDPATLRASSVSLVIEAASVDTRWGLRDDFIRGAEMLDVADHPRITFVSGAVRAVSKDASVVTGLLTIRGVTREERFELVMRPVAAAGGAPGAVVTVTGRIDRTDYGLDAFAAAMGTTMALRLDLVMSPAR